MPETTPLIKAALNLRGGAGFDVYVYPMYKIDEKEFKERCAYKKEILKNIWK